MKHIKERNMVRDVAARWRSIYGSGQYGNDKLEILQRLEALDPETATAEQVAAIIGNNTWAGPEACSECGIESWGVVQLGEEPDYESQTTLICRACLLEAVRLIDEAKP